MAAAGAGAEVWFYHLEHTPLPSALADLLLKCQAKGWRALVRGIDPKALDALDAALWTFNDESFLPHGRDGPWAARQPILLTTGQDNLNGAKAVFLVHGTPPENLDGFERACVVFDGADEQGLAAARAHWKAVKTAGARAVYWRQTAEGGWSKKF